MEREQQILAVLREDVGEVGAMVKRIYAAYPVELHAAAGQSVVSHLLKLEAEGVVTRSGGEPLGATWRIA